MTREFVTPADVIRQKVRQYIIDKYDASVAIREGVDEMSGTELIQWLRANAPEYFADAIKATFGIPRIEAAAQRFGVNPDELQAHCNAGDVEDWLASLGHQINPAAVATELEPEQLSRRLQASQQLYQAVGVGFEYVQTVDDGIIETGQTFQNYTPRKGTQSAYDAVLTWVRGAGKPLLTLRGVPGVGKSHLLMAAAVTLRNRGENVIYRTDGDLLNDWRRSFNGGPDAPTAFRDVDWLIIDDLYRSPGTEWTQAVLDELIDRRYQGQMRTLISTNVDIPSPRLHDRLTDVMVSRYVEMTAGSYRQEVR